MDQQTDQITTYPQSTLVVHVGGIGDFLLCCPALMALSTHGPLQLLGNTDRLSLGLAAGLARAVHDINHVGFQSVFNRPDERFQQFMRPFGRAIIWMKDPTDRIRKSLQQCGIERINVFPGLPPPDWKRHASAYYLGCLGFRQGPPFHFQVEPAPSFHDVIIHPGSGGKSKNWPPDYYLELAEGLRKQGRLLTWCLGPAEEDFPLPKNEKTIRIDSLHELSRILCSACLYIGNDSGITHLAAAVGCRTMAIFGPTEPRIWAPLGQQVTTIKGYPWPEPGEVLSIIRRHGGSLSGG